MDWGTAIAQGINILGSMAGGHAKRSAVKAQRTIDAANAQAANTVRRANNNFTAAQAGLSNFMRSAGNQHRLRAGGEAVNALSTNLARLQDQIATGSLNQQIAAAEQLGAVRAQAAASGAGGTSSAMLHQTLQLAQSRAASTAQQNARYQTWDMLAQRAGLTGDMAQAWDAGQSFATLDYSVDQAPYRATEGNLFTDFLGGGGAQLIGNAAGALIKSGAFSRSTAQAFPVQNPAPSWRIP